MDTIDFHGTPHQYIENDLVRKLNDMWGTETELQIITGNSTRMKEIVIAILDEHKLSYVEGDLFNKGYIKTIV